MKPVVTISLLISNRPETIRRCLDGLKPLMDAVPCELILTDTSKNADIHKMLLEYTDKVYEFDWCNDFAKARNLGLSKAQGEWFMYCDDDEWFVDLEDMIQFFVSGEYKEYGFANYVTRDFIDPNLTYYSDSFASRMFRIDADTRFKSKIHEHFDPVRGKCKTLTSKTHHVGYIFKTQEDLMRHFHRNESLLREMVVEEPDNLRWQIQLVQEYRNIKDWDRVCAYCNECLEKNKTINNVYDNTHMGTFYAGFAEALVFQKKYQDAIAICEQALADKRSNELTKAYMHIKLAESYFWLGESEKTRETIALFQKELESYGQDEAILEAQKVALIVNEVFDETNQMKMYSLLIGCGLREGSTKELHEYYEKLEWKRKVLYVYDDIEKVFIDAFAVLPFEEIFSEVVADACRNNEFERLIIDAVEKKKNADPLAYKNLMQIFAKGELEHWYVWYARIYIALKDKNTQSVLEAIDGFVQLGTNVFMLPANIYEALDVYGIKLTNQWEKVEATKWIANVRSYTLDAPEEHLSFVKNQIKGSLSEGSWRRCLFELGLFERKVAQGPKERWDMRIYQEALRTYATETIEYYGCYYREETFAYYQELLPSHVQAAISILTYLELEEANASTAVGHLKRAALAYAPLAKGIKEFLRLYGEYEKQKARRKQQELENLRNQVVAQVKTLLENGEAEQALAIITQLKQMVPDDLEVINLALEARVRLCQKQ